VYFVDFACIVLRLRDEEEFRVGHVRAIDAPVLAELMDVPQPHAVDVRATLLEESNRSRNGFDIQLQFITQNEDANQWL
jgi:hypothetical protein